MNKDVGKKEETSEIFSDEQIIVDQAEAVLQKGDVTKEELTNQFRFLTKKYRNLLKQARKITNIGDATQSRLIRVQRELDQQNVELEKKNRALVEKNEALVRAQEALLRSQQHAQSIFSALTEALPGTILDEKYRLDKKIGTGGYGAVFQATHLTLDRPVAIKVLQPKSGTITPKDLERFRREGISACRINHPNAVAVSDFGISSTGIAYLVMELLNGKTLTEVIAEKGTLTPARMIEIVIPVCQALADAHSAGVIHRDIKPDNIFLNHTQNGEVVKVLDFGLAKLLGDSQHPKSDLPDLTCGVIVGTPVYMSPERLSNLPYDGKADIYSLGIVMFKMLTGNVPFPMTKGNVGALVTAHLLQQPPSLRKFVPNLSERLDTLVLRTLQKMPSSRPTAKELAAELASF